MIVREGPIRPAIICRQRRRDRISTRSLLCPAGPSLILLLVTALLAANPPYVGAQSEPVGEFELKAAVLANLAKFIEWPPSAFYDRRAPTVICILGRGALGDSLPAAIPRGTNGRVLFRRVQAGAVIQDCPILFISSSERKTLNEVFSTLKGSGVLTVGDSARFAAQGGMIQFALEDQQVRFNINLSAASQEGFTISSKLLALARIVD